MKNGLQPTKEVYFWVGPSFKISDISHGFKFDRTEKPKHAIIDNGLGKWEWITTTYNLTRRGREIITFNLTRSKFLPDHELYGLTFEGFKNEK